MSIDDFDVERLLTSPALVGGKSIWVSDIVVRRHRDRRHSLRQPWQLRLQLRQLLETGRYSRSSPAWVPTDMACFDGYVELMDSRHLIGLARDSDEPRTFRAVSWFERVCLEWDVLPDDVLPRVGAVRVELSAHCVERYRERIVRSGTVDAAREELTGVMQCGRLLPEVPTWCGDHARGGVPAYWLIVDDWLVLPLQPTNRPAGDVFRAVTCMYRGMREDERLRPQLAQLCEEKLRLHRRELLQLAAAKPLRRAV